MANTNEQPIENLQQNAPRRKVFFVLLVSLNIIISILYFKTSYHLPSTAIQGIDINLYTNNLLPRRITDGVAKGDILFDVSGKILNYNQNSESFFIIPDNLYLSMPQRKIRIPINLFSIETRNKNVSLNGCLYIDSIFPLKSAFGYGVIDNFEQKIVKKNENYYLIQGPVITEIFSMQKNGSCINKFNTQFDIFPREQNITLKDTSGTIKNFEATEDSSVFLLQKHEDSYSNELNFRYSDGFLVEIYSNQGSKIRLARNAKGLITSLYSPEGEFNFLYDEQDNLTAIIYPSGKKKLFSYNSKTYPHRLSSYSSDDKKTSYSFEYELDNRVSLIKLPKGALRLSSGKNVNIIENENMKISIKSENENSYSIFNNDETIKLKLDNNKRIIFFKDNHNNISRTFSENGNITGIQNNQDSYVFTYDSLSNILESIERNGSVICKREIIDGLIISEFKEGIGDISYKYDNSGSISLVDFSKIGKYKIKRTPHDNLIREIILPDENVIKFNWKNGRLESFIDSFNKKFLCNRDDNGNLKEIIMPDGSSFFPGKDSDYVKIFPESSGIVNTAIKYIDYEKGKIELFSPSGVLTKASLDPLRRIKSINYANGLIKNYKIKNNLIETLNLSSGEEIAAKYSSQGKLLSYVTKDGSYSTYQYNDEGDLDSIKIDRDTRSFEYDNKKRIKKIAINSVIKYNFGYSPTNDNIYFIEYPDGKRLTYQYNSEGKLSSMKFAGQEISVIYPDQFSKEYNFPNNFTQIEEYDELKNLTSINIKDHEGETVKEHSLFFKNKKLVAGLDNSKRITYSYDSRSLINSFQINSVGNWSYEFDDHRNLIKHSSPAGEKTYNYNNDQNYIAIVDSSRTIPINSLNIIGSMYESNFSFLEINGLGQFIEENEDSFEVRNFPINSGINNLNFKGLLNSGRSFDQILQFNVLPEASLILQKDNKGKIKYLIENGQYSTYNWDSLGNLKSIQNLKSNDYPVYYYLPNGALAYKFANGKPIYFAYDIYGNLIEILSSSGRSITRYFYDYTTNKVVMSFDGKNFKMIHSLNDGSVIAKSDSQSNLDSEFLYSPYGEFIVKNYNNRESDLSIGYLGMLHDKDINCYFTPYGVLDYNNLLFMENIYSPSWNLPSLLELKNLIKHSKKHRTNNFYSANNALDIPCIPEAISFQHDFLWSDHVPVHSDISKLKQFFKDYD